MSRTIKRIDLNFDWPLKKTWEGYLRPDSLREARCDDCQGTGSTPALRWIERMGLMLDQLVGDIDDQEQGKNMHPWLADDAYPPCDNSKVVSRNGMWVDYEVVRPSEGILEFAQGLVKDDENERCRTLDRGFLAQNRYAITRGLLRAAGLPEKWGWCSICEGHGTVEKYEGQRVDIENWEETEPPAGEGWQVWETTSEGSPISPVFAEREQLIDFLMSDRYYGFGTEPTPLTREQAEAFAEFGDSLGSMVVANGQVMSGDVAVHELGKDRE